MKKSYVNAGIVKTREDGVTIIKILGLENNPKAYKRAYQQVQQEIKQNRLKLISTGEAEPVIRTYPSLEIH